MHGSFRYRAQGWGVCEIISDGNTVRYFPPGSGLNPQVRVVETRPSPEEWAAFWSLVKSLRVLKWKGFYDGSIVCGTPWTLELELDGKLMSCVGNGQDSGAPRGFRELYQAMLELARVKLVPPSG